MAQGFFAGGNGTQENPFLIEDADDLNAMRMYLDSYFELMNDINLSDGKYNLNQGWQPINGFTGELDGKNHKIINLYISRPTENYVGFFKSCASATVKNLGFVDAKVTGHDFVGVFAGVCTTYYKDTTENISNIFILNSFANGNCDVGGLCGNIYGVNSVIQMDNIFIDVEIQSKQGIAYGIGKSSNNYIINSTPGKGFIETYHDGVRLNCTTNNCNCYYDCNCLSYTKNTFANCIIKIHKNESITTYYAFTQNLNVAFENCYVDNSEIQPAIYSGVEYKNITDIQHEIDLLPNVDSNYFTKKVNATLEPKFLNNDAIYLQFNNGYHVYDFTNNEFVQKYTKFSNENSKEIIQNGMDKVSFSKIPNSKLKEIQDKYGKVKVVNCINAHKKIVYKTSVLEMGRDKAHSVYRKKIRFNDFNEITSIKKK